VFPLANPYQFSGHDIIDASARAYLNAINKIVHYQMALAERRTNHESAEA